MRQACSHYLYADHQRYIKHIHLLWAASTWLNVRCKEWPANRFFKTRLCQESRESTPVGNDPKFGEGTRIRRQHQITATCSRQKCFKYSGFKYKYEYKYFDLKYKYKYFDLKYKYLGHNASTRGYRKNKEIFLSFKILIK